jgi:heme/copper-type cytochrome/quinol oxidase subunit 3
MTSASEGLPLGRIVPPVSGGVEIPPEPPDVGARALSVASKLLAGATTFFFLAFLFAYFYLRSLNQYGWWRPSAELLKEAKEVHVNLSPDQGLGAAFIACVLLSAALTILAGRRMKRESPGWLTPAIGGLVLGLAGIVLQCLEYTSQRFGPTDGAFASVFCTWTAFYLIAVLATMYWLETQVATERRARRAPAASDGDIRDADRLIAPGLDAVVFYWTFLAGIGLVMYVTLYLL